jgi:hypothetical protein
MFVRKSVDKKFGDKQVQKRLAAKHYFRSFVAKRWHIYHVLDVLRDLRRMNSSCPCIEHSYLLWSYFYQCVHANTFLIRLSLNVGMLNVLEFKISVFCMSFRWISMMFLAFHTES